MEIIPNTLIVGFPKCGTTSVFQYLAAHPEVCATVEKETYYLMDPGHPLFNKSRNLYRNGTSGYKDFFPNPKPCEHIFLEATPDYFYQNTAKEFIRGLTKKPKLLFIVRNPLDRIESLFRFARYSVGLGLGAIDVNRYVDLLLDGKTNIFEQRPILRDAIEHSRYAKFIAPWVDIVGTENILVKPIEDFKADKLTVMESISNYIGIDPLFYRSYSFELYNETRFSRSIRLHYIVRRFVKVFPWIQKLRWIRLAYSSFNQRSSDVDRDRLDKGHRNALGEILLPEWQELALRYRFEDTILGE